MERLTKRTEDGVVLIGDTVADMQAAAARALDRLAAYEDKGVAPEDTLTALEMAKAVCKLAVADSYIETGLMPERVAEFAEADKDGRLVVLPKDQAWWIKGIIDERNQQDQKWGFPQKNTYCEWSSILAEETGELAKELNELNFGRGDRSRMIIEAVQVAAVALAILEQSGVAYEVTLKSAAALGRVNNQDTSTMLNGEKSNEGS